MHFWLALAILTDSRETRRGQGGTPGETVPMRDGAAMHRTTHGAGKALWWVWALWWARGGMAATAGSGGQFPSGD